MKLQRLSHPAPEELGLAQCDNRLGLSVIHVLSIVEVGFTMEVAINDEGAGSEDVDVRIPKKLIISLSNITVKSMHYSPSDAHNCRESSVQKDPGIGVSVYGTVLN